MYTNTNLQVIIFNGRLEALKQAIIAINTTATNN